MIYNQFNKERKLYKSREKRKTPLKGTKILKISCRKKIEKVMKNNQMIEY